MAKPFLQCHHRFKNGKDHCYWSIAEKVRTCRGWVQRHLLYLGEINDSQKAAWTKIVEVFDPVKEQSLGWNWHCIQRIGKCQTTPPRMDFRCA